MIITMNESKYNPLLAKAYQALKNAGKLREGFDDKHHTELGRFLNAGEYYAHLSELYGLDPTYTILPIDEGMFEINANSRAITAPKVVVLQNDQLSKVVIFTVDRYVDFMDLNEAQVWVQWTAPGANGTVREGAQKISIKDTNSLPGKVRLAWLLDDDVTAEAGVVKYSVRFWNKDNFADGDKVVYSLNTITSTLTITPSLQPQLNDESTIGDPVGRSLFARAIRNSQVIGEGIAIPQIPNFGEPGKNIGGEASLSENTLELVAQAWTGDTGIISYEWMYRPAVDIECEDDGTTYHYKAGIEYSYEDRLVIDENGEEIAQPGFKHMGGEATEKHYIKVDKTELVDGLIPGEQYFVAVEDKIGEYEAYAGNTVPENIDLYERYTKYTVPEQDIAVTGEYRVYAKNSIKGVNDFSEAMPSDICKLVSPDKVVFMNKGDLPKSLIIEDKENGAELAVEVKENRTGTKMTYRWTRTYTEDNSEDESDTTTHTKATNKDSLAIMEPGYYKVKIEADLNREQKDASSAICTVTFAPEIPEISYGDQSTAVMDSKLGAPLWTGEQAILDLNVGDVRPAEYKELKYATDLFSEGLEYKWYVKVADSTEAARELTTADIGGLVHDGLGTSTLIVNNPQGQTTYMFECLITNTLNGQTVSQVSGDPKVLPFYVL